MTGVQTCALPICEEGTVKSASAAGHLGDAEGLAAHARAARLRLGETI